MEVDANDVRISRVSRMEVEFQDRLWLTAVETIEEKDVVTLDPMNSDFQRFATGKVRDHMHCLSAVLGQMRHARHEAVLQHASIKDSQGLFDSVELNTARQKRAALAVAKEHRGQKDRDHDAHDKLELIDVALRGHVFHVVSTIRLKDPIKMVMTKSSIRQVMEWVKEELNKPGSKRHRSAPGIGTPYVKWDKVKEAWVAKNVASGKWKVFPKAGGNSRDTATEWASDPCPAEDSSQCETSSLEVSPEAIC